MHRSQIRNLRNKILMQLLFSFRQSVTYVENVTSFLKTTKQVEVCEPVQWLLHAQDWKIFNDLLSCRAVRFLRIFAVKISFMILLVHSSPSTENCTLIGGRGKANPKIYVLKRNHIHTTSAGIILICHDKYICKKPFFMLKAADHS